MQKIRVVGVGAFGSFVGDEFHRNGYEVIGYDDANPHAASRGVSVRTIRGDYADPEELAVARKCRDEWKEKHGSNFYADGRFVVYRPDDDFIEHINEARARLKLVPRIINSPEAVKKLERLYGPAVVPENGKLVLNEDDGLIDLEKAIQRAGESITRRPGVLRLIYSADSKKITGLELIGGITVDTSEDFVILTAGVWTLKLLRDAKIPYLGELPRIVGLFSFPVFLTEEHALKLRREPALSVIGDGKRSYARVVRGG
jgi:glycine/D-amino acid oxidase-like deaminating enzyme